MLTLQLGEQSYAVKPLTVGQVEEINEALTSADRKTANRRVIAIALSEDYPEVTLETVGKMHLGGVKRIDAAVRSILVFGEFIEQEAPKGEAPSA